MVTFIRILVRKKEREKLKHMGVPIVSNDQL
jgi:hypothetical protein